jgi:hypothetical protein
MYRDHGWGWGAWLGMALMYQSRRELLRSR